MKATLDELSVTPASVASSVVVVGFGGFAPSHQLAAGEPAGRFGRQKQLPKRCLYRSQTPSSSSNQTTKVPPFLSKDGYMHVSGYMSSPRYPTCNSFSLLSFCIQASVYRITEEASFVSEFSGLSR